MKTIFIFDESYSPKKLTLRHKKEVRISREERTDHRFHYTYNGEFHQQKEFIVIRFPKGKIDVNQFKLRNSDNWSVGYQLFEREDHYEMLFYDRETFTWNIRTLEKMGLFHVTERVIPHKEELFAYYLDAKRPHELLYNAFFMSLQWLLDRKKKRKESNEEKSS